MNMSPLSQSDLLSKDSIRLTAAPGTDYWRKPPSTDISNAPTKTLDLYSNCFRSAFVTISGPWSRRYDQGGLLIMLPPTVGGKRCWLKAGIEFEGGKPNLSIVAAREWADWSLHPLQGDESSVTIEIARQGLGEGVSLSVYVWKEGERFGLPLREVTWAFEEEGVMEVGVYTARPTKLDEADKEELTVEFTEIGIDFKMPG